MSETRDEQPTEKELSAVEVASERDFNVAVQLETTKGKALYHTTPPEGGSVIVDDDDEWHTPKHEAFENQQLKIKQGVVKPPKLQ